MSIACFMISREVIPEYHVPRYCRSDSSMTGLHVCNLSLSGCYAIYNIQNIVMYHTECKTMNIIRHIFKTFNGFWNFYVGVARQKMDKTFILVYNIYDPHTFLYWRYVTATWSIMYRWRTYKSNFTSWWINREGNLLSDNCILTSIDSDILRYNIIKSKLLR